ncbi:hypothetical protein V8C34DRAFT_317385 [Trichoderma compactum]
MSWFTDCARPCPETSTANNNNNIQYPRIIRSSDSDDSHQTPYRCMLHPAISTVRLSATSFATAPMKKRRSISLPDGVLRTLIQVRVHVRDSHRHELSEEKEEKDGKRFHSYRAIIRDD